MPNFISELKKRKVFSSSAIYLGTAFIILQVAQVLIPALHIPDWTTSFIVVLLMLGFPVVLILSWIYDISEGHIVKTVAEKSSEDDNKDVIESKSDDDQLQGKELSKTEKDNQEVVKNENNPIEEKSESSTVETENSDNESKQ